MRALILALALLLATPACATDYELTAATYAIIQTGLFAAGMSVGPNAAASVPWSTHYIGADRMAIYCYGTKYVPAPFVPTTYGPYVTGTGNLTLAFSPAPGATVGTRVTLAGFTGADAPLNGVWPVASSINGGLTLGVTTPSGLGALSFTAQTATLTYPVAQSGSYCILRWEGPDAVPAISGVTVVPLPANTNAVFF